jgi:hypothetical protein
MASFVWQRELNPQTLSFQDFGSTGSSHSSARPAEGGGMGGAIGSGMLKPQTLDSMHDPESQQSGAGALSQELVSCRQCHNDVAA